MKDEHEFTNQSGPSRRLFRDNLWIPGSAIQVKCATRDLGLPEKRW